MALIFRETESDHVIPTLGTILRYYVRMTNHFHLNDDAKVIKGSVVNISNILNENTIFPLKQYLFIFNFREFIFVYTISVSLGVQFTHYITQTHVLNNC